jgi:hypothetical protein
MAVPKPKLHQTSQQDIASGAVAARAVGQKAREIFAWQAASTTLHEALDPLTIDQPVQSIVVAELNLYQKLSAITGEIGNIAKGGTNKEQGYSFIEYAAVAGALRTLFAKYHVVCLPTMGERKAEVYTTQYGKRAIQTTIEFKFTLINSDKPEEREVGEWVGEASDTGDKGTNKAATAALKYYLMRTFQVSEKGDEDPDATTPEPGAAHVATKPPAAPTKPKSITMQDAMARLSARMTARGFTDGDDRKRLLLKIAGVQTANDLKREDLDHVGQVVETATTATLQGYLDIETATTAEPTTPKLPDLTPPADQPTRATIIQMSRIKFYMRGQHVEEEDIPKALVDNFGVADGKMPTFEEATEIIEHFSKQLTKSEADREAKEIATTAKDLFDDTKDNKSAAAGETK